MSKCNILLNGEHYKGNIDTSLFTIAADGGYNMIDGKAVDVFLGDGDSVASQNIRAKECIMLSPEKDMTDGEYAVDYAIEHGYDEIMLYGADGGRLDHVLTNINLFARAYGKGATMVARCNQYDIYFTEGNEKFVLDNVLDKTISLVPFDVSTHIIDMKGLYYKVSDYHIARASSRGMSNVASEDHVEIEFGEGMCFIFVLS